MGSSKDGITYPSSLIPYFMFLNYTILSPALKGRAQTEAAVFIEHL